MKVILRIVLLLLMMLGIMAVAQGVYRIVTRPGSPTLVSIADVEAGRFPREDSWWRIKDGHLLWENALEQRRGNAVQMFIPYASDASMAMDDIHLIVRNFDPKRTPELANAITARRRGETFPIEGEVYPADPPGSLPESLTSAHPGIERRVFVLDYGTSANPVPGLVFGAIFTVPGILMIVSGLKKRRLRRDSDASGPRETGAA